ncbi:hypothetical protein LX99_00602 [Mucilaginibacter oryzae]|uniref:Uncharacterized protein n=1 Tax=Mucilaginibacter oryzae TaxID=468058 RepID=A0A316HHM9_9SPHI|nr:hypothetical protein [Mucilaginibacter oryzae]PWK80138.1 hypothetical protein LX99_00602 [Mucilaginibacter oryzae]
MSNLLADTELETELQELFIQARHWQDDIYFLEDEIRFFRNILLKYDTAPAENNRPEAELRQMIENQESRLANLKSAVPEFIVFLKPYVGDNIQAMDLNFLERYNDLQNELTALFAGIKKTKTKLFAYAETVMAGNLTTI